MDVSIGETVPTGAALKESSTATRFNSSNFEIDSCISDEERRFYIKAYPTIDIIIHRKVHCTVCRSHIGTAPAAETNIKMHPVLRVTHCIKCHDFYNSGEFSKGEDGSELYCRWCGQGGEVYCCSSCPYVFCKSCIVKNLSRGVVADIEQNENWSCFNCAPKILWPLRAQHWALINYIETQKKSIQSLNLTEAQIRIQLSKDTSQCCRLAKSKANSLSDSLESLDSNVSKRSHASAGSTKKSQKSPAAGPPTKRQKSSNDEVVCTPDLFSMLEPDCQITMTPKTINQSSTPKIKSVQPNYSSPQNQQVLRSSVPPPLVLANTTIKVRPGTQSPVVRRTVVGLRQGGTSQPTNTAPVYHTINGYRIDLNSAAQQETFRLPNGKLIQVKRQGPAPQTSTAAPSSGGGLIIRPRLTIQPGGQRPVPPLAQNNYGHNPATTLQSQHHMATVSNTQMHRNNNGIVASGILPTGTVPIQVVNGAPVQQVVRPQMIRHVFPNTPIGVARTQLQDQIFNAMDICTHLTGKVQTLTNSNAYKQARNYLEVKELYIHLSYLVTYAIGRFKGLQDKCLADMRQLGFSNDADSLENGQLAAAVDYVSESQLSDADFFNTGSNSFHNQVYEYRKRLHDKLDDSKPLPPLFMLGVRAEGDPKEEEEEHNDQDDDNNDNETENWQKDDFEDNNDDNDEQDDQESYLDNDGNDNDFEMDDYYNGFESNLESGQVGGTEESMTRNEEAHAYDRKLTRLIREYPSIWCTRHPDYGNFEVTRKQWRVIASHFKRGDNIKLRWKNIRKRYVRIERRMNQGKRFHGYFDKATNYLSNRDLPENEWNDVDCGDEDGDICERKELEVIEGTFNNIENDNSYARHHTSIRPIDVQSIDARIIEFAKSHPVLWRKSSDPQFNSIDEQTRKSLWLNFWKSVPNYRCEYIMERWQQMYEMYKSFRLKVIKDKQAFANLELRYSKYLAKLYFLYKIDEEDLREEREQILDCDNTEESTNENEPRMLDMPDDKAFVQCLVQTLRSYPTLWNSRHFDYGDASARERLWSEVAFKMQHFKRDTRRIKKRWQLAKFAYECYNRELNRQPAPNEEALRKLRKNLPVEDMWFINT